MLARLSYYVQNLKQFPRYGSGLPDMFQTVPVSLRSFGT